MVAVVTGASGHIGANLVRALVARGSRVRVVRHRADRGFAGLDVEAVPGDVLDRDSLEAAFSGAEVVYHLAGVVSIGGDRGGMVRRVNVEGAENAASAALRAGVRRFVHCSSIHAFDLHRRAGVLDESSPRVPSGSRRHSSYDLSKAEGERLVREVARGGLDLVVVHPTSVVGPVDPGPSRMGRVLLRLRDRSLPALVPGGFDFVDVRDVAAGLIGAAERGVAERSYLLSGRHAGIDEIGRLAAATTGVPPPRITVPSALARIGAPFAAGYARVRGADPLYTPESLRVLRLTARIDHAAARRDLGYSPRPLEQTVADLYRWFAEAGM